MNHRTSVNSTLSRIALTALLFYFAGQLALPLSLPPSYATAIWPPAGIGFAATLLWGNKVLPAIFLAELAIHYEVYDFMTLWQSPGQLLIFLSSPVNSVLRAWTGAFLVKRIVGYPNPLISAKEIMLFFLLSGPVATLIPALLSVYALVETGVIVESDFGFGFLTWWLGDCIGIVVFTPLFLTIFEPSLQSRTKRWLPLCTALTGGLALVAISYLVAHQREGLRLREIIENKAETIQYALEDNYKAHANTLSLYHSLIGSSDTIDYPSLQIFSEWVFNTYPSVLYIEWLEASKASQDKTAWTIKYSTKKYFDNIHPISEKCHQEIVLALEPQATTTDRSSKILSFGNSSRQFFIYTPFFETEQILKGYVIEAFDIERFIEDALVRKSIEYIDIRLFEKTSDGEQQWLFPLEPKRAIPDPFAITTLKPLNIGGQSWFIQVSPDSGFLGYYYSWPVWGILAGGMLLTSLMGIGFLIVTGQTELILVEVEKRTHDLNQSNRKLRFSEEQLRLAATAFQTQEGIMITDKNGRILRVNNAFTEITGYSSDEVIGKIPSVLRSRHHNRDCFDEFWKQLASQGQYEGEIWNRRKTGEVYPEWQTVTAVKNEAGEISHFVSIFSDITEKKENESRIHNLAFYDPLTNLPNRRLLINRLEKEIAVAKRHGHFGAVIFMDLDHFKFLNDSLGHHVGDELLIQVANRLESVVRDEDTAARLGGDEFIVLINCNAKNLTEAADHALTVAEKINAKINEPFLLDAFQHQLSPSMGITLFPDNGDNPDRILQQADTAMYRSKASGRNSISFFHPNMQEAADLRIKMENELREAIDQGHFVLNYQAQFGIQNEIIGAEALIRWQHPQKGLIPPIEFIKIAEESHLILQLGRWVIMEACLQIQSWQESGLIVPRIAVNVSSNQFRQSDFVDQIEHSLKLSGITPDCLEIELTEHVVIDNIQDTIEKMKALKALGLSISIDDFGTGYSSLAYLKQLPLNQLKIDKSFVRDISTDPNDAIIVETMIAMAKHLGLTMIAEGVETAEQLAFLKSKGCTGFQGYYFRHPVTADQFAELLSQQSPQVL
ncbi:MAG: EAL domain-containing protein [Methylomicrobium sp.]|nr:EAL domain-containing protein [Methylomicrobium sp.]